MNATPNKKCPQCGGPLPTDAFEGICPRCLMQMNLADPTVMEDETGKKVKKPKAPSVAEIAPLFPQLEILELIGQGGMGAVYKARQKDLDRVVALKILPKEIGEAPGFAERFTREARALAKLNHPGIVTLYEFGRADGLYFFLMEYVDGLNLRQLLHGSRISPREALAIVPQICDALQYAHDHGIVHRDIKPENILLDRRGNVKVADFGLAKMIGSVVPPLGGSDTENADRLKPELQTFTFSSNAILGTPKYMSPEQVEAPGTVDHRADIYALGVVFYQMLTGDMPDKELTPPSKKVRLDVRLDEVVLRALEKKPELRYQQASILKTQVETIASSGDRNQESGVREPSRFSRTAIVGACLTILFFTSGFIGPNFVPRSASALMFILKIGQLVSVGVATILGWVAVSQIRRSAGKLYGLGLAVFDGLLFPLLLLDGVFAWVVTGLVRVFAEMNSNFSNLALPQVHPPFITRLANLLSRHPELTIFAVAVIIIVVDWLIIRRVWRAVNRTEASAGFSAVANTPSRTRRWTTRLLAGLVVVVGIGGAWFGSDLLKRQQQQWTSSRIVRIASGSYGPVVERTLTVGPDESSYFDLDGDCLVAAPTDFDPKHCNPPQFWSWLASNNVDVMAQFDGEAVSLVTSHMIVGMRSEGDWNSMNPIELQLHPMIVNGKAATVLSYDLGNLPLTLAFKTLAGQVGLLQVTGFTENPRGVKIRYKLVQMEQPPLRTEQFENGELRLSEVDATRLEQLRQDLLRRRNHDLSQHNEAPGPDSSYLDGWIWKMTQELDSRSGDQASRIVAHNPEMASAPVTEAVPGDRNEQIAVEDLARRMIVAIRKKDDDALKSLATDRLKGWPETLIEAAGGLREYYQQSTNTEWFDLRMDASLVEGDLALVGCSGPAEMKGKCYVFYFVKTAEGWRNHSLRGMTDSTPLTELMAGFKEEVQRATATAAPNSDGSRLFFGPVMERVIHSGDGTSGDCLLDLDAGTLSSPPSDYSPQGDDDARMPMEKWFLDAGIDVMADGRGLAGFELVAVPVAGEVWNRNDADWLASQLASTKAGTPALMSGNEILPATYLFKTREGGMGLLQITGFTENPRGVKIRYKLVKNAPAKTSDTAKPGLSSGPIKSQLQTADEKTEDASVGIVLKGALKAGEFVPMEKSARVVSISLKSKPDKARVCVGLQFTSREIWGVRLNVQLLDAKRAEVARFVHVEPVGPEVVITPGHNLDHVQRWDQDRAIWIDLPKEAETAVEFSVSIEDLAQAPDGMTARQQNLSFGPVMERVVQQGILQLGRVEMTNCWIHFETGSLFGWTDERMDMFTLGEWIKQQGVDAACTAGAHGPVLETVDGLPGFVYLAEQDVFQFSADEVSSRWNSKSASPETQDLGERQFPQNYIFQTHHGKLGALQILGATQDPPSLKIRYKLVQSSIPHPANSYAWQQTGSYTAPDFDGFFPDDAEGGNALDTLWNATDKDARSDEEILATVRNGLRRTRQHRTLILSWIGNKYIWGKSPQNPDAIEIMYHAADFSGGNADPYGTRHYAVYFGLSVVQPKTPAILRTLAELCMRVDDPNDLGRVAWGAKSQKEELIGYLKPYLESPDEAVRTKAEACRKIFEGELEAFAWATEQARAQADKLHATSPTPDLHEGALNASVEPDRDFIVRGIVTDEKGNGLPGVTLTAHAGIGSLLPTGQTQTDKEGRYLLQFGPGFWSTDTSKVPTQFAVISPSKEGYFDSNFNRHDSLWIGDHIPTWNESHLNVDPNRFLTPRHPFDLNFVLLPATALEGRLLEPDGQPAAGRNVYLSGDILPPGGSILTQAQTDSAGHFEFKDVPTIGRWWFFIEEGRNEYRSEKINFAPDIKEHFELQISSEGGTRRLVVQKRVR